MPPLFKNSVPPLHEQEGTSTRPVVQEALPEPVDITAQALVATQGDVTVAALAMIVVPS